EKPPDWDAMLQSMPGPPGRASVNARPVARPSPELLIVTVKPICSPAFTEAASAVFSIPISAQRTIVGAEASSAPSLPVVAAAVWSSVWQASLGVRERRWTLAGAPAASVVGL